MKHYSTIVVTQMTDDPERYELIYRDRIPHDGEWEECKGDGTAKDQLKRQNDLVDKQLAMQQQIRDQIMGSIGKYLSGDIGFDPQQLAIMQSQFLDQNAAAGSDAQKQIMSQLLARGGAGGDLPAGGDTTRALEGLYGQIATSKSQGILGTNLANLQQALTNKFNAASVAGGQSAQLGNNIGIFNNGANNALDQYVQAASQGFGAAFTKSLGGALGQGIGGLATTGIGSSLGNLGKYLRGGGGSGGDPSICWIAAALWGEDARTALVRRWLMNREGSWFVRLYKRYGRTAAAILKRIPILKAFIRPVFDRLLSNAVGEL